MSCPSVTSINCKLSIVKLHTPLQLNRAQVHKIAVLDIRLVNTDRNGANILAKQREGLTTCSWELTPIDHGYCLPGSLEDASFEWLWWSQAAQPFDAACLEYISRLDAGKDIALLRAQGLKLRPECERVLKVSLAAAVAPVELAGEVRASKLKACAD